MLLPARPTVLSLFLSLAIGAVQAAAAAPQLLRFSPQGKTQLVHQVTARFSAPMAALGATDAPAPFTIACKHAGRGQWLGPLTWTYEFERALAPGARCTFRLKAGLRTRAGALLAGTPPHTVESSGITAHLLDPHTALHEEAGFGLGFNAPVDVDAALAALRCQAGAASVPVRRAAPEQAAALRASWPVKQFIDAWQREHDAGQPAPYVLLRCAPGLPPGQAGAIVVPATLRSAEGVAAGRVQRLAMRTAPPFGARVDCTRSAEHLCHPRHPIALHFSEAMRPEDAAALRLAWPDGQLSAPRINAYNSSYLEFAGPFPQHAAFTLRLPAGLRDVRGRPYSGAAPLPLQTGALVADWMTPRAVALVAAGPAPQLAMAVPDRLHAHTHRVRLLRLDTLGDAAMFDWLERLRGALETPVAQRQPLIGAAAARTATLAPASPDPEHRTALPLPGKGLYLLEWPDGPAAADGSAPGWVHSAVLVTDLALHVRQARESALVWVTSIDSARPVAGARISVSVAERLVWSGRSDADGLARIPYGTRDGALRVLVRHGDDTSFAPAALHESRAAQRARLDAGRDDPELVATVFDSMLVQPGATLHMKHLRRRATAAGLVLPPDGPAKVMLAHQDSGRSFEHSLQWLDGQAAHDWQLAPDAPLGRYTVSLDGHHSGSFRVETLKAAQSGAAVEAPAQLVPGQPAAPLRLNVSDLNGGPGRGAVSLRGVLLEQGGASFPAYPQVRFGTGLPRALPYAAAPEQAPLGVQRHTLGADGSARFALPQLPASDRVRRLKLEFTYFDANGESRSLQHHVQVLPAATLLAAQLDQAVVGAPLAVGALVVDLHGQPLAGHAVRLSLAPTAPGAGAETPVCSGATDAAGRIGCSVAAAPRSGFILIARSQAGDGQAIAAHQHGYPLQPSTLAPALRLAVSDSAHAPDGVARIGLEHGFESGSMLTTIEREGILDARVTQFDSPLARIEVPLRAAHAPNVSVHVIQARPGAATPAGASRFASATARVKVAPTAQTLQVAVQADRAVYRPGDEVKVALQVSAADGGAPGPHAEVALAVLDAGLLALSDNRSWDLLSNMMQTRWTQVHQLGNTDALADRAGALTEQVRVSGSRSEIPGAPAPASAMRIATSDVAAPARALFDPQVFWRATVKLDKDGRASIPLRLNDSLSRFRIVAVAHAGADRFGHGSTEVITRQDLELRAQVPPVVRAGDRLSARFSVRNRAAHPVDASVAPTLHYPDGSALALAPRQLAIAAGGVAEGVWTVDLPAALRGTLRWSASARAGAQGDRLDIEQQVLAPERARTLQATLVQLNQPLRMDLALPAGALDGTLTVNLSDRLDGGLPGVRRFFALYPYDCLEQRLSRAVALGQRAMWDEIAGGMERYLDPGRALLRFFPGDQVAGSDTLSVQVLQLAGVTGWALPADLERRLLEGLRRHVHGKADDASARDRGLRRLASLALLASRGKADQAMVESIEPLLEDWPSASLIDWLTLLRHSAHPRRAEAMAQASNQLRARLYTQGGALALSGEQRELRPWSMGHADVSMARLLVAVRDLPEWRAELPALMRGLMLRQRDGHWHTTLANAWGALAMRHAAHAVEAGPVDGVTRVVLGSEDRSHAWEGGAAPSQRFALAPGASVLALDHAGGGAPWASVSASAIVPLAAAQFKGIRIRKSVTAVEQHTPGRWSRGDVVRVRLDLEARADSNWVVVDDPIPPGATVLGSGLGGDSRLLARRAAGTGTTPTWQERGRAALRSYYQSVPRGAWQLTYLLRLDGQGTFKLPATHAEAMYQPEVAGDLPNPAWTVGPGPQ